MVWYGAHFTTWAMWLNEHWTCVCVDLLVPKYFHLNFSNLYHKNDVRILRAITCTFVAPTPATENYFHNVCTTKIRTYYSALVGKHISIFSAGLHFLLLCSARLDFIIVVCCQYHLPSHESSVSYTIIRTNNKMNKKNSIAIRTFMNRSSIKNLHSVSVNSEKSSIFTTIFLF